MAQPITNHLLVSVLMPVYNSEQFVKTAVTSILTQTYSPIELIVVDDCSSDASWQILQSLQVAHPTLRIYRHKKNQGTTAATNYAFSKARGQYIAIMDSDDVAYPSRVAKQVEYLQKNPTVVVAGAQVDIIGKTDVVIGAKHLPQTHAEIYDQYGSIHPVVHPSIMINRALLPKSATLYESKYGIHDDYYNMFRLLQFGEFANLPEKLLQYRIHGNNNSLKSLKNSFWTITKIRLDAHKHLNYRLSPYHWLHILIQMTVVSCMPELVLKKIFGRVRGYQLA